MKKILVFVYPGLVLMAWAKPAEYSSILKRNVFTEPAPAKPPVRYSILKPAPLPSLDTLIEIKGIVYSASGESVAILKLKSQNYESIFRTGELVCPNVTIQRIEEKNVIFDYDGKQVILTLQETGQATSVAVTLPAREGTTAIKAIVPGSDTPAAAPEIPAAAEPIPVSVDGVVTEIRKDPHLIENFGVAPNVQEGRIEGFRVSNVPENSLPYQYGLRSGDIIRRVNGVLIDSLARAFTVYQQILNSNVKSVTVEVLRNNKPVLLTYQLQ